MIALFPFYLFYVFLVLIMGFLVLCIFSVCSSRTMPSKVGTMVTLFALVTSLISISSAQEGLNVCK